MPVLEGATLQMIGHVRLVRFRKQTRHPRSCPSPPLRRAGRLPALARRWRHHPAHVPCGPRAPTVGGRDRPTTVVDVPAGPPPLPDGAMEVQVLRPPRFVTEPGGKVELGGAELELLARLALDPGRTFTGEELRADIGAGKKTDWAASTLWTRASSLRKVVGTEHVPLSSKTGGYRAVGISTDVARFEAALARSRTDAGCRGTALGRGPLAREGCPVRQRTGGHVQLGVGGRGRRHAPREQGLRRRSRARPRRHCVQRRGPRPVGYLQGPADRRAATRFWTSSSLAPRQYHPNGPP